MDNNTLTVGLSVIFSVVLVGPFLNKWVESNLEIFLFVMGAMSATLSSAWSSEVIHEELVAPINITLAVLGAGVLFHYVRWTLDRGMRRMLITVPLPAIVCAGIIILGLISSIISAIIAALLLVEFITVLPLHRHAEVNLTIIACFAIGLGAALTPLGEPLSEHGPAMHARAPESSRKNRRQQAQICYYLMLFISQSEIRIPKSSRLFLLFVENPKKWRVFKARK